MSYEQLPYLSAHKFCVDVFKGYGFSKEDSEVITDVLLHADLFGIESHGVQRLIRYHNEITSGMVDVGASPEIMLETPVSAVVDAHKGMGQTVSIWAMRLAIEKAKKTGIGMVSVRNSNHYGIAGYYPLMAVKEDLAGICMTNTEAIAVPTFGRRAMLGTNPIALGMPAEPVPFLFDAATTVVPRGKVEVYQKNEKPLPDNWAVDSQGVNTNDPDLVLKNIIHKLGGGIAPLGGSGDAHGGHKGYGLGIIVDIFSAIFSGGKTSNYLNLIPGQSDINHFFCAFDYGMFGDKTELKSRMSTFLQELRDAEKAEGYTRIYTHGEKEMESKREKLETGFPVNEKTRGELRGIAEYHGLDYANYF